MLAVEGLTKSFGGFTAVADVALSVEPGTIHAVIGPNGAGKTTLFNLVTGVLAPSAGRLVFEGQDITGWRADRVTARGVARTFQNIRLFREMTAVENVMVGVHCRTSGGFLAAIAQHPWTLSARERETIRGADGLLDLVGLAGKRDVAADELTLVEQRRLEIARALATGPRLLLLDEPAAGMTPPEIEEANRLITADPRPRRHRAAHRAPHEPGHAGVGSDQRAQLRPQDRRGESRDGAARPRGARRLPGSARRERRRARCSTSAICTSPTGTSGRCRA